MNAEYKKLIEWAKGVMPEHLTELHQLVTETKTEVIDIRSQAEKKLNTVDLKDLNRLGKYYAISKMLSELGEELSEVENLLNAQVYINNQPERHTYDSKHDIVIEEKIGVYAKRRFAAYFEKENNPPLEQFLDKDWCHANFGICYPLLKEIDIKYPVKDQMGYLDGKYHRFWKEPILEIHGKNYIMCSQWYRQFRAKLDDWFDANNPD